MSEAAITALAPWFGAKRTMAPEIVRELGDHHSYWEPFCGSMAVLLAKPPRPMEAVNDLHGDLINLARVVADDRSYRVLLRRLRRVLCCETWPAEARSRLYGAAPERDPIERAFWYFLGSWLGRNGCAGTHSTNNGFCRRFTGKGGSPAKRLDSAVRSIPAWHRRMKSVIILDADAFDLLARIEDAPGVAVYCDPPYLVKGAKYLHDFDGLRKHVRLARALRRFRATRVVVSYYDHPYLPRLYPGWNVRKVDVTRSLVNQGRRDRSGATKAPEVLLVNGPLLGDDGRPSLFGLEAS